MNNLFFEADILWSQIDANQHLRHSAYADFAAQARLCMLEQAGITTQALLEMKIGPILFREEISYLREVGLGDRIRVCCELARARKDGSRWTIRHELYRRDDTKVALIMAEGAWIDMEQRKLAVLPPHLSDLFMTAPKSSDFTWEEKKTTTMTLNETFDNAVTASKQLPRKPDNEQLLQLYSLYKQATEGDISEDIPKPQLFDFVGKAKYDAWAEQKGKTREAAMAMYIELVQQLQQSN